MVRRSWFVVHGSSCMVRRAWFVVHGSSCMVRRGSFSVLCNMTRCGTGRDSTNRMVAKRYEELEAWRLADELKREVYALINSGAASKDFGFCDQIRDSAASNTKNIAE